MNIQTVFIFEIVNEARQIEVAKQKAAEHPNKLANVCYHRLGESHNKRCYTIDLNAIKQDTAANIL